MKKYLIPVVALAFMLMAVSAAYANPDDWNPPGPTFRDPVAGDSPHGTYATTNDECEVCHSPHQAGSGGVSWKLLRATSAAAACDYCHNSAGVAGADYRVYVIGGADVKDGLAGGHEIAAFTDVPDDVGGTVDIGATLDCFDCHTVHGANSLDATAFGTSANGLTPAQLPTNAILKQDPGGTIGGPAANINEYCDSCHTDNLQTAVNGSSHFMGDRAAVGSTRGATELATQNSTNCSSCHTGDAPGNDYIWPHNTTGEGLMSWDTSDAAGLQAVTRDSMDANCLGCHGGIIGETF